MPEYEYILFTGYVFGFYMAWNIGANDVANSMASAVGAKAITIRQAVFIAGVLNLAGAVFLGSAVTNTIRKGIVSQDVFVDPHMALIGVLSAILAASLWVSFATWKSLPVSTTHSIVGAMIGFGISVGGPSVIQWGKLTAVILSWIISPVFSFLISFTILKLIIRTILSRKNAFKKAIAFSPAYIGMALFVITLSFLYKTPFGKQLSVNGITAVTTAAVFSLLLGILCRIVIRFISAKTSDSDPEAVFRHMQVGTSCYVALAQGANDVANAIGPLAVIYFIVRTGNIGTSVPVPVFLLCFGGIGIVSGIYMYGYRVMATLGSRITTLTNTRGFSVDFAAATTVLIASKLGLPVSTTHAAVGGIVGVGVARGLEAVNYRIILRIMLYWILTVPAAALSSMILFKVLILFIY